MRLICTWSYVDPISVGSSELLELALNGYRF
jgi:hypothetical protein